jgi:hypothetical protein
MTAIVQEEVFLMKGRGPELGGPTAICWLHKLAQLTDKAGPVTYPTPSSS